ncbi:TIGR04190 family B12-binding domain/radical SAM domain protein [Halodesulfurarchaeum sp. HSR-GB]|uniref:TIGR04190 family B12-binding domain/radical SAM domain protein n=1 Tax=Halodesulfurarchaeum sp. HSR-GB TaxID=3074077 RepID=UPI002856C307|nr:TIGR04190 family B12-binding domain/radical SAM domain protein [Halodesulfurarchaeum sp. HSR-GB]MDR5657049.1 TIGR04190 family B12-binding domain/radical SAM domain protein [Halodesulfurarchaeum sp. HSR-GB]
MGLKTLGLDGVTDMFVSEPDVTFFHPPSIYDFRERPEVIGPISDVIPSSPVFEMYPIGLTSIADTLERNGYNAQIVNLAHEMLVDSEFDVEREIAESDAWMFGVDLHWLPHAHGAIEIARLIKKHHPEAPVVFGGLSSTYFHEDLIEYPSVDYVVRGDSTEEPVAKLVETIKTGGDLSEVPNLTYQAEGETVVNELTYMPEALDDSSIPSYTYAVKSVFKYGSVRKVIPHRGWLDKPITMLLTSRGCRHACSFCGGANSYGDVHGRQEPAFRSPEKLIEDIRTIRSFSEGPIFVVHDLRMGGWDYAQEFFDRLASEDIPNEFIFELFGPADEEYFQMIDEAVESYSLELSPESHVPEVRKEMGKFAVSNEAIENTMQAALDNGCQNIDLFYMIGLPDQTYEDAVGCVEYAEHILEDIDDERIIPFVAPYAPFLDPGSPAFEQRGEYGFEVHADSLEDYRQLLLEPSWKRMLSYETEHLSRDDIADATYEAARKMNRLKYEHGLLEQDTYETMMERLETSEELVNRVDEVYENTPEAERDEKLKALFDEYSAFDDFGENSIAGADELWWPSNGFRNGLALAGLGAKLLVQDLKQRVGNGRTTRK